MRFLALAALVAASLLSACGHRADLQRPPPIWGDRDEPPVEQREPVEVPDPTEAPSEREHSPQ